MPTYPTGENANALIDYQRERIKCMEKRISELEAANDLLKRKSGTANAIGRMRDDGYICIH